MYHEKGMEKLIMFNKLRSLFSSKKTHSKQSPINELLLTDEEVKAVEYAHNCILIQMISGGAIKEGDTKSVFHDAKYITPWIIGYLAGILDYSIRATGAGEHARYELQQFFIFLHFAPELEKEVSAVNLLSHAAMSGKDTGGFAPHYGEDYIAGAQAGFDTPPNVERDTPKLELHWYLSNNCTPRT